MDVAGEPLLVLTSGRSEVRYRVLAAGGFVVVGFFLALHPLTPSSVQSVAERALGVAAVAVFGLALVQSVRSLLGRRNRLEIGQAGFWLVGRRSERFIRWGDCSTFVPLGFLRRVVFNESVRPDSRLGRLRQLDAQVYGWTSVLPSRYDQSEADLAALMNRCRNAAASDADIREVLSAPMDSAPADPMPVAARHGTPRRGPGRHR